MSLVDVKKLWDLVLADIELSISKPNFLTWFKDTAIVKIDEGVVYLAVPNTFVRDWLHQKFHKQILDSLRIHEPALRSLEYTVSKDDAKHKKHMGQRIISPTSKLPLEEHYINKEDNLNPRYTFETFVVGPFNELAHAASQSIIKSPGYVYNPLFIYGDAGRGKTHLIQAIGNYIKKNYQNKKVFYVTSEKFAVDFFNSISQGKANQFKEKYRQYDVLIMDDIQFFANKEKTQEEVFHLFNVFHDHNKQLIFSSDKHPQHLNLEERLRSRMSQGIVIDVPAPDFESRVTILKAKALQFGMSLLPEIIDFIATEIEGNIRELEGVMNTLYCQIQLKQRDLTLLDVKNLIKSSVRPKKNTSVKEVVRMIAEFYDLDEDSIYQKTRKKEVVKPRQVIMYILREDFGISYPTIGEKLGGRDHTTVIHSYEKIHSELKVNPSLTQEISQIRTLFS